jgi:hypothetical protein
MGANLLDRGAIVLAEVGDGFVIRRKSPGQPHHLKIPASLTLQLPARLDPVEIAVNVELEHRRRMVRWPAGRCWINAIEPEVAEFQRIHKHIDRANGIALIHPIIEAFRKQRRLLAIGPLNEIPHHFPRQFSRRIIASTGCFHTAWVKSVVLIACQPHPLYPEQRRTRTACRKGATNGLGVWTAR